MIRSIMLFTFIVFFITSIQADELESSRIELEAKKKVQISKSLELTSEQSGPFWDVYAAYERDLAKITKESFDLIRKFSDQHQKNTITEQSASNMLSAFFRLEGQKLQMKQQYLSGFKEVLPTKKVFRFYQIDNKIDSLIRCDIAKKLPLIEPDMEF
ncbi:MAG: hypothetical protein R8G33_07705 [Gammaproteobacteria bacterium]|nr:hypothetical protein [Gammaproteobacteria bacterium]